MRFKDRVEAGQKLADILTKYQNSKAIIIALPRGGVVLGGVLAERLKLPLDLIITRKIGHPMQEEYAIGAVAEDGHTLFNEFEKKNLDPEWIEQETKRNQIEAQRRRQKYLPEQEFSNLKDKDVIIVDDGIATGLTMALAISEVQHHNPKKIIVAVPIIPTETAQKLEKNIDELIALEISDNYLGAVGAYYDSFPQVSDEEVINILKRNKKI